MGPIVGNRSNSNATEENCAASGFYLSNAVFMKNENVMEFDALNATAKFGTTVESLSAEWYTTNLPSFDFESIFVLDDTHFPKLK